MAPIAQFTTGRARTGVFRPAVRRVIGSVAAIGEIALDAIEATRAIQSAHSAEARRVVLDRFAAETARHANRSAA